jgi:hypothetical protein
VPNNDNWKLIKWLLSAFVAILIFGLAVLYGLLIYIYAAVGALIPIGVYLVVTVGLERTHPDKIWLQNPLGIFTATCALIFVLCGFYFYGDFIIPEGAYISGGKGSGGSQMQAEGGTVAVLIALLYLVIGLIVGAMKLSDLFAAIKQKLKRTKAAPKKGLPR